MALTYYYDDEHNVKLLNILKYGLMLLGLGLVYCSTSMTEASATLCVLLLASIPASLIWDKRYACTPDAFHTITGQTAVKAGFAVAVPCEVADAVIC